MPRTMVQWNLLPATVRETPSVDTFKARLCNIKLSTYFTRNKLRPLAATHILLQPFSPFACSTRLKQKKKNINVTESDKAMARFVYDCVL